MTDRYFDRQYFNQNNKKKDKNVAMNDKTIYYSLFIRHNMISN